MALTDSAIRALKPREKAYKAADEKGLYLLVTPAGDVISSSWEDLDDVIAYGSILELDRAWISPLHSGDDRFSRALKALMQTFSGWSILVLKAFPIEYGGLVDPANQAAFRLRSRALMRHYSRILGVAAFPGDAGRNGWMFAIAGPLVELIDPPQVVEWASSEDWFEDQTLRPFPFLYPAG